MVIAKRTKYLRPPYKEKTFLNEVDIALQNWTPRIFVGSSSEGLPLVRHVKQSLRACGRVTLWPDKDFFRPSNVLFSKLVEATTCHDFAVMLATPDDHLVKRGKQLQSMRDNVLFEFGLFSGALGHEQAFLLIPRDSSLSLPSDLAGLLYVKYEKASAASVSRACRTISRAISSSARSRRSQIMKNARDILKSKQYRAARQLQLALKDILTIYKSLSQEVRDAASTTALRRLKEKAVKALSGIYKKHEQEIRLLGVKKEAKKLVRTLATAITKFPEFGDTETQFLALMLKSPIGNSYLTWLKSCEQQVSNAALDLNLAVTGAFDPMIIESFSPMMTSSMWQQLDRAHAMKNAHRLLLEGAKNSRAGIGKHPLNLSI